MKRMKYRVLLLAIAAPLLVSNAFALSVGEMSVNSKLGEPLAISIGVRAENQSELDSLKVQLAPRAAFQQSGVPYPEEADDIQFSIDSEDGDGGAILRVRTNSALDTPYLHLLMQLSWSGGNMLREYVALIDPADYGNIADTSTYEDESVAESYSEQGKQTGGVVTVEKGDTVSGIAKRYRPNDVSMQQVWMAFYNLNRSAFPTGNIDLLETGVRLTIPTREQMLALSQRSAINKVKSLSPYSRKAIAKSQSANSEAGQVVQATSTSSSEAEPNQDELIIGVSETQVANTGFNSAAVENLLEGKFGEMASIKADINKFSEEMIAVRGENQVVANRLSQVETQLSKISQLLEMQSQTLASLNEQARLQAQAMQEARTEGDQLNQSQQVELQQLKQLAQDIQANATQAQIAQAVALTEAQAQSQAKEVQNATLQTASQSLDNALNNLGVQEVGSDNVAQVVEAAGSEASQTQLQKLQDTINAQQNNAGDALSPSTEALSTQASQTEAGTSALSDADISEEQRKARIAELEATLQAKIAEARQKQNLQAESGQDSGSTFLNTDDWTGSVVSAKNKIAETFRVGIDKLSKGSMSLGMMELFRKWGWYLLLGVLGLIGLGAFMRRRGASELDDGLGETFRREVDDGSDLGSDLLADSAFAKNQGGEESSIFELNDESLVPADSLSKPVDGDSSLFAVDEQDSMMAEMESEARSQQSTIGQVMDVDPLAEAEVYLAYDRKAQAIKVLKDAYDDKPKDQNIAIKLMGLYQSEDDADSFGRVLETAFAHKDEDSESDQWGKIKAMGKDFTPTHTLFMDNDFDSSIPVLHDEVEGSELSDLEEQNTLDDADNLIAEHAAVAQTDGEDIESLGQTANELSLDLEQDLQSSQNTSEDLALDLEQPLPNATDLELEADEGADEKADESAGESVGTDPESFTLDMDSEAGDAFKEINQHDPDTSLALAKAYVELGEKDIAKDFLSDVIATGNETLQSQAKAILKKLKA